jgi:hypothetical protein
LKPSPSGEGRSLLKFVLDHLCGNYDTLDGCKIDLDLAINDLVTVRESLFANRDRRPRR